MTLRAPEAKSAKISLARPALIVGRAIFVAIAEADRSVENDVRAFGGVEDAGIKRGTALALR